MSVYAILASPLLLETQQFQLVDRILVIDTSEQHQLERASHRDKSNEAQIKAIMQTQLSRQERCARATDIIQNHGSIDELDAQVEKLHQLYLELAQSTAKTN
jgi:dephospho-CoA kinase